MIWMLVLMTFVNGQPQFQYDKRVFPTEAACQSAAPGYSGPRWDAGSAFWRCISWQK